MNKPYICTILVSVIVFSYITGCSQNNSENLSNNTSSTALVSLVLGDVAGTTERISVDSSGLESNSNSISSSISNDGQFVVYDSAASNLVVNDNNATWDIFLRDRAINETYRISQSNAEVEADGESLKPKISGDGNFVVYASSATNLVESDTNAVTDIFLYDVKFKLTERISLGSDGSEADAVSTAPNTSYDGRYIVFESKATNLAITSLPANGFNQIYVYDRETRTTELVSLSSTGEMANGDCNQASISDDGQIVSFSSPATNLASLDNNNASDIFVHFRRTGVTTRVSVNADGIEGNGDSRTPAISGDGQHVAFMSSASNLVANDTNSNNDIFLYELNSGVIERVSIDNNGVEANASSFAEPAISADGQVVVFYTSASNLSSADDNSAWDVFVRDRINQSTQLISVDSNGVIGNASSFVPAISASAQYIVFGSQASNLVLGDSNNAWDVFLHIRVTSNLAPIANAGLDQDIYIGTDAILDGSLSYDPDARVLLEGGGEGIGSGLVAAYQWNILSAPSGSAAALNDTTIVNPTLTPDKIGQYVITLTVNDGVNDSIPDEVFINVSENLSPQAIILADITQGDAPLTVTFDATNSTDPEGESLSYQWNFDDPTSGDQNISNETNVTHTFAQPQIYNVILSVTDAFGNIGEAASIQITVTSPNRPPVVSPVADKLTGPPPLSVNFSANASDPDGDVLTYLWDFGDGATSSDEKPQHIFNNIGTNIVKLTVSDSDLSTTVEMIIIVDAQLELDVLRAKLQFEQHEKVDGKINFKAKVDLKHKPAPADQVIVLFDGVELLNVPFSDFHSDGTKDDGKKGDGGKGGREKQKKYKYESKGIHAILDLKKNRIFVVAHKLMLHDLNYCNGVDVLLRIGQSSGLDHIVMLEKSEGHDEDEMHHSGHHQADKKDSNLTNCDGQTVHNLKLVYKNKGKIDGDS